MEEPGSRHALVTVSWALGDLNFSSILVFDMFFLVVCCYYDLTTCHLLSPTSHIASYYIRLVSTFLSPKVSLCNHFIPRSVSLFTFYFEGNTSNRRQLSQPLKHNKKEIQISCIRTSNYHMYIPLIELSQQISTQQSVHIIHVSHRYPF